MDKFALPFDSQPYLDNVCPLCKGSLDWSSKHHLIPRSQGGSDVPGNLIWVCGDGTRGCHGVLETRSKGTHGLSYNRVAIALVRYVREEVPEYGQYTDAEKYEGYVESRYLGEALNARRPT